LFEKTGAMPGCDSITGTFSEWSTQGSGLSP